LKAVLELTLSHDGHNWVTDDMSRKLCGNDLHHLEDQISNAINTDPRFTDNESIDVTLLFDMDRLPRWLHQYQSHYFNYTFTVDKPELD